MADEKKIPQIICYGELLWESLDANPQVPGGTPLNIVYHLLKLKKSASLISRIGNDDAGKMLVHELKRKKISMDFCQVDGHYITGVETMVMLAKTDIFHKIIYPAAWDFIEWKDYFSTLASESDYFVFDSLAARNLESRKTLYKMVDSARTNVFIVNLRTPHFNIKVIEHLLFKSAIVRMDMKELEIIMQWNGNYFDELSAMLFVKERYNIQTLILMKGEGCVLLNMGNKFFYHTGYPANRELPDISFGSDAFTAAFLSKLIDGSLPEEILNFTCAVSSVALRQPQWQSDYELKDIFALMSSV